MGELIRMFSDDDDADNGFDGGPILRCAACLILLDYDNAVGDFVCPECGRPAP